MTQAPATTTAATTPTVGDWVIAIPLADVRRKPDANSELVNQALLGTPAAALAVDPSGAWTQIRLPDYEGWVATVVLAPATPPAITQAPDQYVRVGATTAVLRVTNAGGTADEWTVYAGTLLRLAEPVTQDTVIVDLPDGRSGVISARAITPLLEHQAERGTSEAILTTARQFLTTPYLWGGMSVDGIDCSGFVQTVYRVHGYTIPRDADTQFAGLPVSVAPGAWQPGDLLFFGPAPDNITHVTMYIGQNRVIHATGRSRPPAVVVQSLDPADPDYINRTDYIGARRVIPGAPTRTAN